MTFKRTIELSTCCGVRAKGCDDGVMCGGCYDLCATVDCDICPTCNGASPNNSNVPGVSLPAEYAYGCNC